jgi:phosphoribosylformimino-5-aminoimidazole carboxamide ribotide isomerase
MTALALARRVEDAGAAAIIYTDISRDGAMEGPNIETTVSLARAVNVPVIASGGVSSMADLMALKKAGDGLLEGVISGRAVYDGLIDVKAAVKLLQS